MRRLLILLAAATIAVPGRAETPAGPVKVAVFAGEGAKKTRGPVADRVDEVPGYKAELVTADDIRAGKLADYRVLICPGGSGSVQAKDLGTEGREKVKEFVKNGGGYVGICAGSYLASKSYSWSLGILDADVIDREHWARGTGPVDLKVTGPGKEFFGTGESVSIYYGQGPLLVPGKDPAIPDYDELASYETEIHSKGGAKPGVMKGTTAAARGSFGAGRVFCWSPHPEKTSDETAAMFRKALVWAAGK